MRTALGAPLQNISENILNRVISKNIQADLRKYKMNAATRGRGAERATSNGRQSKSPLRNRRDFSNDRDEAALDAGSLGELSKEVSHYLSDINTSN